MQQKTTNKAGAVLVLERKQQIMAILTARQEVQVADLARKLDAAEESIRRNLDRLESMGKLVCSHGGSVAILENKVPHWPRRTFASPWC